jgi:hypothetical protein
MIYLLAVCASPRQQPPPVSPTDGVANIDWNHVADELRNQAPRFWRISAFIWATNQRVAPAQTVVKSA